MEVLCEEVSYHIHIIDKLPLKYEVFVVIEDFTLRRQCGEAHIFRTQMSNTGSN
jgi:hypothetical protein